MTRVEFATGIILPFAAMVLLSAPASAASPQYCSVYSREYAITTVQPTAAQGMLQSVQDQAYNRCLNLDQDPVLPQISAYANGQDLAPAIAAPATPTPAATSVSQPQFASAVPLPSLAPTSIPTTPPRPEPRPASAPPPASPSATASALSTVSTASAPSAPRQVVVASVATTYRSDYHGSGMTPWTSEWKDWCARNFPNSWDPKTGTILNYGADRRELCR